MNNIIDKHQMFLDNDKLIYLTMKKYFPHIFYNIDDREEYYQIGAIGLLKAIERYDSNKAAFSTYAVQMIWGEIKRNIRDNSTHVHYSRKIIDIANRLNVAYHTCKTDLDYEVWINNEITKLDISYNEQMGVINYIFKPINLDTPTNDADNISIGDSLVDSIDIVNDIEYNSYVSNINDKLSERDKKIFKEHILGAKQQEIADNNNITQAQVSRILKRIKYLTIVELYAAENYTLVGKLLLESCSDEADIKKICKNYGMDFQIIYKCCKEIRINTMQTLNTKIYSKKTCQKLILKCVMKLILKDKITFNNENNKHYIEKILIDNNYDNDSIFTHLHNMTNNQFNSCIDLAKRTIKKYNYLYEYEILVDELDFNPSKFIKKEPSFNKKHNQNMHTNEITLSDNIIDNVISILECFRRDNLMVRF